MPSRRRYLVTLAALTTGCAGIAEETPTPTTTPTATPTDTPTPSPTPTPTPEQTTISKASRGYPSITTIAAVSKWEEYGDVHEQQTNTVPVGSYFGVASRFEALVNEGEVTVEMQVEVYHGDTLVTRESETTDTLTDDSGVVSWEMVVPLYSDEWETGDYIAEVILQDTTTSTTSDERTVEFQVTEEVTSSAGKRGQRL